MKKILTIILLLTTVTLSAQPLMLSCRKMAIKSEMRRFKAWQQIPSNNGLKYVCGAKTVFYTLNDNVCTSASITMPEECSEDFIKGKLDCNCWCSISDTSWIYNTNLFDTTVVVIRFNEHKFVRFNYKLNEK